MRIFLGIPTAGSPAAPFIESLRNLQLPHGTQAFERGIVTGNFVPAQRDVLVERALQWNADFIAMCDDDIVLVPNALAALVALLQQHDRAALSGALYYSRDGLRPMLVDGWSPEDTSEGWIPAFDDKTPTVVDGIGFGFVVIRAAAIADMKRPFFAAQIYVERNAGRVRVCNEDYLFCHRLRTAGHDVYLHPGVRVGHYDRTRDTTAPPHWELSTATNQKRVLAQTGNDYKLIPLENAPTNTQPEHHTKADITYIETNS